MNPRTGAGLLAAMLALATAAHGQATAHAPRVRPADERKVVALLKSNPIVVAAVRQAQRFRGARSCAYGVLSASAAPNMSDEVRDFEAEITCTKDEASGVVRVRGRLPGPAKGFEEVQVSVFFAG